jgi:hypothetical protein
MTHPVAIPVPGRPILLPTDGLRSVASAVPTDPGAADQCLAAAPGAR